MRERSWCLVCHSAAPVFPSAQPRALYQTWCDGLGFALSTQPMICNWGGLGASNGSCCHKNRHVYLLGIHFGLKMKTLTSAEGLKVPILRENKGKQRWFFCFFADREIFLIFSLLPVLFQRLVSGFIERSCKHDHIPLDSNILASCIKDNIMLTCVIWNKGDCWTKSMFPLSVWYKWFNLLPLLNKNEQRPRLS